MKTAIIGSRDLVVDLQKYLPAGITMVVSGGSRGIDTLAELYAYVNDIPKMIFLPEYDKHGKQAPLVRSKLIVDNADMVVAFWDGKSAGTKFAIDYAKSINKEVIVHLFQ